MHHQEGRANAGHVIDGPNVGEPTAGVQIGQGNARPGNQRPNGRWIFRQNMIR
jgi:hypothetical protein